MVLKEPFPVKLVESPQAQEQLQVSGQVAEDTNQHGLMLEAHPQAGQCNEYRLEREKKH